MTDTDEFDSLAGNLLLAMPAMADPFFSQTATLICEHSVEGAMGIVINQPTEIRLEEVFEQLKFDSGDTEAKNKLIGYGGPVGRDQGFMLHSASKSNKDEQEWGSSIEVAEGIGLTTSPDIVEAVSHSIGPEKWIFVLGYAGWSAGQLETELAGDSWIVTPATAELVFNTAAADLLKHAASQLGVDFSRLGPMTGSA
jgi:putative transcriptional regulator